MTPRHLLAVLMAALFLLAACAEPVAEPAAEPLPTPVAATATPLPPPPTSTPTAAPPTPEVVAPAVVVHDQEIVDGSVTIAEVVSDGPGWLVIHAEAEGRPGPVIGYSPVVDGGNADVVVQIDLDGATETLYAMLHTDAGIVGEYEFPGADAPVSVDGQIVTPAFTITGLAAAVTPSVTVNAQAVENGAVTIAEVTSDGPGWLVIHAEAEGRPGPVIGYSPVADGVNTDVTVALHLAGVTPTLYAMLHTDAGEVGVYEFPGADAPVTVAGQVVTPPFAISSAIREFVLDPERSTVSYSINEILLDEGNVLNTAIGRTSEISGALSLDFLNPDQSQLGQITVDISTLTSDRPFRDSAIRERWLESARFPISTFTATQIAGFPQNPQPGEPISFQLMGDMLIKETTRPVTWDVTATLEGDTLTGAATMFILLADFNVPTPSILGAIRVTDGAELTFEFTLVAGG